MFNQLLLISHFIVGYFNAVDSNIVFVNSSEELEMQLNHFTSENLYLKLDSSIEYRLSNKGYIHFTNRSFTMVSSNGDIANISCNNDSVHYYPSTTGIAFVNSVVHMSKIRFIRCGLHLRTLPRNITSIFNETSQLYYRSRYASTLLFIHSCVNLEQVEIQSSNGFAILGFNLIFSSLRLVQIGNSSTRFAKSVQADGSGIMLHFGESQYKMMATRVSLINVTFRNNTDFFRGRECLPQHLKYHFKHLQVYNAAGLTILYAQKTYQAQVIINGGKFIRNAASYTGGILIFYFETRIISTTIIRNSEFRNNAKFSFRKCHGVALLFLWLGVSPSSVNEALTIEDSTFTGGLLEEKYRRKFGSIFIGILSPYLKISFTFRNLHFSENNNRGTGGTCMTVSLNEDFGRWSNVNVTLDSIRATNNANLFDYSTPTSLFHFIFIQNVTFKGNGTFENNFGSVIFAEESNVYLDGNVVCSNNTGERGGCIQIEGNSLLFFMESLTASFINNRAYFGGAIYVDSNSFINCAIQVMSFHESNITFASNYGKFAGNSIFAVPIAKCFIMDTYHYSWSKMYTRYFKLDYQSVDLINNSLLQLSTSANEFTLDYKERNKYVYLHTVISPKYPGETIFLRIRVRDIDDRHVYSNINMEVSKVQHYSLVSVWLKTSGGNRALEGKIVTDFNISIHTSLTSLHNVALMFSISKNYDKAHKVTLLPCPLGFELHNISGSCECSRVITEHLPQGVQCFIDSKMISIPDRKYIWIGTVDNNTAISTTCPLTYCNSDPYYKYVMTAGKETLLTNDSYNSYNTNETVRLCLDNRIGTLCGQCNESNGYALAFGSNKCIECTNTGYYLSLTIITHLVGGLILILIIYVLQLTLTTGTLNGIIFYAQAVNAGLMEQISVSYYHTYRHIGTILKICHTFLTFLNLDLGFSICSFKGMTQLWKTGLTLIFPIYLLTIVVVIIIASHYSTWFSNRTSHSSVQVLVTVVHLSFSKLLLALINVFTPATIHTSQNSFYVWYWDGSIKYMGHFHLPLVIVTTITVSILLMPYITLLLLGTPLTKYYRRASFYLRPVLEAVHAPYKENKQYWFVARLFLVIIVYMMYVIFRSQNVTVLNVSLSCVLSLFLIGQALFQPFRSKLINVLDCWLMLNITLVYVTLWSSVSSVSEIVNIIAVMLAALTLLGILLYHTSFVIPCLRRVFLKLKNSKMFSFFKRKEEVEQLLENTDSFYGGVDGYREPLHSSKDN